MAKPKAPRRAGAQKNRRQVDDDEANDTNEFDPSEIEEFQRLIAEARVNRPKDKKTKKKKQKSAVSSDSEDDNVEGDNQEAESFHDEEEDAEASDEERVLRELRAEREGSDNEEEDMEQNNEDESEEEGRVTNKKPNKRGDKPYTNEAASLRELAAELRLNDFVESLTVSDETVYAAKLNPEEDKLREARFEEIANRAVKSARDKLDELKIPHRRPTDFMAEMIKSDDHMARVKRRLLFEQQKMKVVEARKAAERNKRRNKEAKKQRDKEKVVRKREAADIATSFRDKKDDGENPRKKARVQSGGNKGKHRMGKQKRKSMRGNRGKN